MKVLKLSLIAVLSISLSQNLSANENKKEKPKRTIKANMTEVYNILPKEANSFSEMFENGVVYGRLRLNSFKWVWDTQTPNKNENNNAFAIGGSLIYKTASLNGFSATAGVYTSQTMGLLSDTDLNFGKSGKDLFSSDDKDSMTVLAQSYLEYSQAKTSLKVGRQIFESTLTASNDTKMIPNTFSGVSLESKYISDTTVKVGYFDKQKLRNHTEFHDVIGFASGVEQDDSAIHKGLTKAKLDANGIESELIVLEVVNKSLPNLTIKANYTAVPDIFYDTIIEGSYKIDLKNGYVITPAVRYLAQFDDGGGVIGGASLNGKLAGKSGASGGYVDADNLDSSMIAAKIEVKKGAGSLQIGYSKVSDDADLIAPWRSFPTGGYTRSMAQYNWLANTKSWMILTKYDFNKANLIKGLKVAVDYVDMDFDEIKGYSDRDILHIDLIQNLPFIKNLSSKVRVAFVDDEEPTKSYNEYRFEMNYLF